MAEKIEYIRHSGQISGIDPQHSTVTVSVIENADCGGCPASKLCNNFDSDKNTLVVPVRDCSDFKIGDFVTLYGSERIHRKAIMLCTVIPSIALVAVMIGVFLLTANELAACLSGIGALVVFYVFLYLVRNKIAHEFTFNIEKSSPSDVATDK